MTPQSSPSSELLFFIRFLAGISAIVNFQVVSVTIIFTTILRDVVCFYYSLQKYIYYATCDMSPILLVSGLLAIYS